MTAGTDEAAAYERGGQAGADAAVGLAGALTRLSRAAPWPIVAITAVAAALRFAELQNVSPNEFYDAAVRSMSMSWRNFLFGAFDPAGILSIDKPPLDLWLQVVSVKVLGWGQFALKLPEALAGTCAVPLLYDVVRRALGRPAGLIAAAALAAAPESVLTARSDTMDSVMMMLVIAALWLVVRAAGTGQRRPLVLAGVALGLAFNVKLLEGFLCLPALVVIYALLAPVPIRRKMEDLGLAALALVGVSLAWAIPIALAPGSHPWPIGSSDGTVWNAMFVFNGVGKVSGAAATKPGGPGLFRLLVSTGWHYDMLFGCVLVAALALGLGAVVASFRTGARAGAPVRLERVFLLATAVWIVCGVVAFDTMRTVHARYLDALAPAVAIAIGAGAASLAGLLGTRATDKRPQLAIATLSAAVVCAYTFHFHERSSAWGALALLVAAVGAGLVSSAGGRLLTPSKWIFASLLAASAMVFPIHQTLSLVRSNANDSLGLAVTSSANAKALSSYLEPRTRGVRYEVVADEPLALAPLIISDRRQILPLTSFGGRPLTSLSALREAVRTGEVRYGLVARYRCGPGTHGWAACTPAAIWIRRNGVDVTAQAGLNGASHLYRLPE